MASEETESRNYEVRRQARGYPGGIAGSRWKRVFYTVLGVMGVLLTIVVTAVVWYNITYVRSVRARLRESVVVLSPEVDGCLSEVYVTENQNVTAGQVLARLNDAQLQSAVDAAESACTTARVGQRTAEANVETTRAKIDAEIARAGARVTVASSRVKHAEFIIKEREARLTQEIRRADAMYNSAKAELEELEKGARKEDIEAAQARLDSASALLNLYRLEVKQSEELVLEGIDSQHLLEVRKTRLSTQQNAVREAELQLARLVAGATPEQLEAARQTLTARDAALQLAKAAENELDPLRADLAIREAELLQAEAELKQAEARSGEVTAAKQEAEAAEARLERSEAQLASQKVALGRLEIRSPVDGIVTRIFDDIGELCRKGRAMILVADGSRDRWIEAFVREEDAMWVEVGDPARVRVPPGTGDYVEAVVEQVGLHTESLDGGADTAAATGGYGRSDRVWVKLGIKDSLEGDPVTGTTAQVVIKVR